MRQRDGLAEEYAALAGFYKDRALTPMAPAMARIPMADKAHGTELNCTTCHKSHDFNTKKSSG